jgi:hypothetical protein|tara:strand:- start:118 stop:459 length:342 start_codon:yes stop_codon:yes gene_type:complete
MKKMHYVNLYEIHSCYGGSEEGGWWYSAGEPVGCKARFVDPKKAQSLAKELREKIQQPTEYKMGFNSMDGCDPDGNGDDNYITVGGSWGQSEIAVLVQSHPPREFPEERPRYE